MSEETEEMIAAGKPFMLARKIVHPKERMVQYMDLQNKTYTNEKLARLKIIESSKCKVCLDVPETRDHLFEDCQRAQ